MKSIGFQCAVIILASIAGGTARADPLTIYGIPFGGTLPYPPCETVHRDTSDAFSNGFTEVCIEKSEKDEVIVHWPTALKPSALKYDNINAFYLDGKIQFMLIFTNGEHNTDDYSMISALTKKFGKPSSIEKTEYQNGYGATYEGVEATWKTKENIIVEYESILDDLNTGSISIMTDKYKEFLDDELGKDNGPDL